MKGAKGDVRSAGLFINNAHKLGLLNDQEVIAIGDAVPEVQQAFDTKLEPGDILFAIIDVTLLSTQDQIELARYAQAIDRAGNITALGTADFERVKEIIHKARGGENVVPS